VATTRPRARAPASGPLPVRNDSQGLQTDPSTPAHRALRSTRVPSSIRAKSWNPTGFSRRTSLPRGCAGCSVVRITSISPSHKMSPDHALERAGLGNEGFTFHSLRHTFATELFNQGRRPKIIQSLLGHSSIVQTMGHLLAPPGRGGRRRDRRARRGFHPVATRLKPGGAARSPSLRAAVAAEMGACQYGYVNTPISS
jgi:hypothetical protein